MHGLPIDFPNDAPKRLNGDAPECLLIPSNFNIYNKSKINLKKACFVFEIFVPLCCQIETAATLALRRKIASIKSRNCAH